MNTSTLQHPGLNTNTQTIVDETIRLVDLEQMHVKAGLDSRDLPYLAASSWQRPKPQTFKGISIE